MTITIDDKENPYISHAEKLEQPDSAKLQCIEQDHTIEQELTFRHVLRNHKAMVWWCFYFAMCAVGWGFDAQVNGAMIAVPSFRRDFGYILNGEAVLPAKWQSAFNTVSSIGQFFGGFLCSAIADKIGRKKSIAIGILVCTGGIIGQVVTTSKVGFLMAKLILGLGLGFYLTLGPLCCSEITPVVLRGISTSGINLGIALGQLVSNSVIKGFGERDDRWAYRAPFALQFFFAIFLSICLPFAPESPWWLVRNGRIDEARESLRKLYGSDANLDTKIAAMRTTIEKENSEKQGGWLNCFQGPNLLRTNISCGVFICQHLVGIIFVLGYSTYFFQLAGLHESQAFNLGVGVTACGVFGNICSWGLVNTTGRRKVFVSGMFALTTLLLLIGIMDVIPTNGAKWVQASLTVIYAFVYFLTIGAIAFVLLGETSSTALRAPTMAFATATQAVMGIAMNVAIPYMVNPDEANLKGKVGFVFGGLALFGTIGSYVFIPELKGRTFKDIDTMFSRHVPPRKMGSYVIEERDA
ncbi:maltose permease [Phaeosphaeriaceae sp. PMI808]|nr:maltose permease [Phaeosphaeriaceae sp. PMI808]